MKTKYLFEKVVETTENMWIMRITNAKAFLSTGPEFIIRGYLKDGAKYLQTSNALEETNADCVMYNNLRNVYYFYYEIED